MEAFLSKSHRSQNAVLDSEILQVLPIPQPENMITYIIYEDIEFG